MGLYSAQQLLELYNNNFELDFKKLYKIANAAGHIDWHPEFKYRDYR